MLNILSFHATTPQSRLCRESSPYTVEPWDRAMTDFFNRLRAVPFGTALSICTRKTAPPTRCCNFTIHFSAFRRSGFLSDIYIISDLYKTVSVNHLFFCCAELPLMRRNSDILRLLSFRLKCRGRCRSIHPSPFSVQVRLTKSSEYRKFLIFCSAELSDKLWRAVGVLIFAFAVHRTRLQSFLSVPLRYSADPAPGAFSLFASSL